MRLQTNQFVRVFSHFFANDMTTTWHERAVLYRDKRMWLCASRFYSGVTQTEQVCTHDIRHRLCNVFNTATTTVRQIFLSSWTCPQYALLGNHLSLTENRKFISCSRSRPWRGFFYCSENSFYPAAHRLACKTLSKSLYPLMQSCTLITLGTA